MAAASPSSAFGGNQSIMDVLILTTLFSVLFAIFFLIGAGAGFSDGNFSMAFVMALFGVAGWSLPGAAGQVVRMLGDSATPVALFTIGAVLWRAGQHAHTRTPAKQFVPVALFKVLVHPLLVLSVASGAS